MSFKKTGAPLDTISVLKEDGKTGHYCSGCSSMTEGAKIDRKAFANPEPTPAETRCGKCGKATA